MKVRNLTLEIDKFLPRTAPVPHDPHYLAFVHASFTLQFLTGKDRNDDINPAPEGSEKLLKLIEEYLELYHPGQFNLSDYLHTAYNDQVEAQQYKAEQAAPEDAFTITIIIPGEDAKTFVHRDRGKLNRQVRAYIRKHGLSITNATTRTHKTIKF